MNAREIIEANEALRGACRKHMSAHSPLVVADNIVRDLSAAGFTIMSKEDVEAVREEAIAEYKAAIDSLKHVTDADLERVRDKALEEGCGDSDDIAAYEEVK